MHFWSKPLSCGVPSEEKDLVREVPTIGPEKRFYGYITALGIENWHNAPNDPMPRRLFATFEYNGKTNVWIVPDEDLFKILSSHLNDMAWHYKNTDEYGYAKLWIEKRDGEWHVDLP
jgi:hypothetical protein